MTFSTDSRFHRQLFLFNGLLPALLILLDGWRGKLGANPVEFITRSTGVLTLVFLMLTLMVTPLRKYAFFYGRLLTYLAFQTLMSSNQPSLAGHAETYFDLRLGGMWRCRRTSKSAECRTALAVDA
jgi:hypothetical protein